jgi:hypothetical protein
VNASVTVSPRLILVADEFGDAHKGALEGAVPGVRAKNLERSRPARTSFSMPEETPGRLRHGPAQPTAAGLFGEPPGEAGGRFAPFAEWTPKENKLTRPA